MTTETGSREPRTSGQTLYDKLWDSHVIEQRSPSHPAVIYIDLHLIHEGSYLQAFETLRRQELNVRRPDLTLATTDHFVPTARAARFAPDNSEMSYVVDGLIAAARENNIEVFTPNAPGQGIVHVIGPELGYSQPGMTIVCGDSHTTTHGAFGALAFGIGTTQVAHVLATQCLLQYKQKNLRVTVSGSLATGATSKDLALYILAGHGVEFGRGYVLEFTGDTIRSLDMSQRMTLCNMTIEMGAKSGVIAPDDVTFEYLAGRARMPAGARWEDVVASWSRLTSDPDAQFDDEISIAAGDIQPMVTYGTTPAMSIPVTGTIPSAAEAGAEVAAHARALSYMNLSQGDRLLGQPVGTVFIGSCTNARVEDLRLAAGLLKGRRVADSVRLSVVPGSQGVKRQAEAEGLDDVFRAAGGIWGEPSCSMCLGANGDIAPPGSYTASTSNRNFEGRQGPGARTLLMSPLTAAATAVAGTVADPRQYAR